MLAKEARLTVRWLCSALLAFISLGMLGSAQDVATTRATFFGVDAYLSLLDTVFPREYAASSGVACSMILRFMPPEEPESQLEVLVGGGSGATSEVWLSSVENGKVWDIAQRYTEQTGDVSIQRVAELVTVERRRLDISHEEVQRWHSLLDEALESSLVELGRAAERYRRDGSSLMVLHGTRYDFWYAQGAVKIHWSMSDINADNTDENPILPLSRWMNTVRSAADGAATRATKR